MEQLITIPAYHPFDETVERIISLIKDKGFTIFSQIDHAAEAIKNGLFLRPTKLIIFGNPKVGTSLMNDRQSCGIDLPVKILIWEAVTGKVWLSYNSMSSLKCKHQLSEDTFNLLRKIEKEVARICAKASGDLE